MRAALGAGAVAAAAVLRLRPAAAAGRLGPAKRTRRWCAAAALPVDQGAPPTVSSSAGIPQTLRIECPVWTPATGVFKMVAGEEHCGMPVWAKGHIRLLSTGERWVLVDPRRSGGTKWAAVRSEVVCGSDVWPHEQRWEYHAKGCGWIPDDHCVTVTTSDGKRKTPQTAMKMDVLFDAGGIVVVNKPPMLRARGATESALVYVEEQLGRELRPVHITDRTGSGLLLLTERKPALMRAMIAAENEYKLQSKYWAVVKGAMNPPSGIIDTHTEVPRDPQEDDPLVRPVAAPTVSGATVYHTLAHKSGKSWLLVQPQRNARHQVRQHLHSVGHGVCGDRLYMSGRVVGNYPHLLLHFHELELALPAEKSDWKFSEALKPLRTFLRDNPTGPHWQFEGGVLRVSAPAPKSFVSQLLWLDDAGVTTP